MDPVAAFGLVSGVIQFIDFTWRLFIEAESLYKSHAGLSTDKDILMLISNDIISLNARLIVSSAPDAIPDSVGYLAGQCKDVAAELLEVLRIMQVRNSRTRWKSFEKAGCTRCKVATIWPPECRQNTWSTEEGPQFSRNT